MVARELSTRRKSDFLLGAIAFASVLLHVSVLRSYGWFRDELYYLACGRHLDFGYVDHPPFVALVARAVTAICGDSLAALARASSGPARSAAATACPSRIVRPSSSAAV